MAKRIRIASTDLCYTPTVVKEYERACRLGDRGAIEVFESRYPLSRKAYDKIAQGNYYVINDDVLILI